MSDGYTFYTPTATYITVAPNTSNSPNSAGGGGLGAGGGNHSYSIGSGGQIITYVPGHGMRYITLTTNISDSCEPITISQKEAGCSCKKCDEFNEYAEPNQADGTFICFGCRRGF